MSGLQAPRRGESLRRTRLIAAREFRERATQRAYRIAVVVGMVAAVVLVVLPTFFSSDDGPGEPDRVVVFVDGPQAEATEQLRALGAAGRAVRGGVVEFAEARSAAGVREAVGDDDAELGLVIAGPATAPVVRVVTREDGGGLLVDRVVQSVDLAAARARAAELGGGGNEDLFAPVVVRAETVAGSGPTVAATAVVSVLGLVLYIAGIVLTQAYATGVVSDRSNRVTERLLTAVRPFEHLTGKLVGVGAAGLLQFGAWIAAALVADAVAGSGTALDEVPTTLLVYFPIALVLTYLLYSAAATILVLPVRKAEDVGSAIMPAVMLQVAAFIAVTTIVTPGATISGSMQVLSLIPFFSPLLMLGRLAGGDVATWELVLGIVGPLVLALLLLRIAAPAYARYAIDAPGGKGIKAALATLRR